MNIETREVIAYLIALGFFAWLRVALLVLVFLAVLGCR